MDDTTKCPVDDIFFTGGDHSKCQPWEEMPATTAETEPTSDEERARASIAAIETAATWVSDALNDIARLEDERALIKPEAIRRIMESRGMAATPAEKIVEADPEYAAHRAKQRDAEVVKWAAVAKYEASKLTAKLDVSLAMRGVDL